MRRMMKTKMKMRMMMGMRLVKKKGMKMTPSIGEIDFGWLPIFPLGILC